MQQPNRNGSGNGHGNGHISGNGSGNGNGAQKKKRVPLPVLELSDHDRQMAAAGSALESAAGTSPPSETAKEPAGG